MDFIQNYWKIILFVIVIAILYNLIKDTEDFEENVGECNSKSCGLKCECDEKCTNQFEGDRFSPCSCKGPTRMIF